MAESADHARADGPAPLEIRVPLESLVGLRLADLAIWQMHVHRADTGETLLNALYVDGYEMAKPSVDLTGIDACQLRAKVRAVGFPPDSDGLRLGEWIDATLPTFEPPAKAKAKAQAQAKPRPRPRPRQDKRRAPGRARGGPAR